MGRQFSSGPNANMGSDSKLLGIRWDLQDHNYVYTVLILSYLMLIFCSNFRSWITVIETGELELYFGTEEAMHRYRDWNISSSRQNTSWWFKGNYGSWSGAFWRTTSRKNKCFEKTRSDRSATILGIPHPRSIMQWETNCCTKNSLWTLWCKREKIGQRNREATERVFRDAKIVQTTLWMCGLQQAFGWLHQIFGEVLERQ